MRRKAKEKQISGGFTLIEITVTVGIFIIIITIVVSVFVNALQAQRGAQTFQEVQSNGQYIMEMIMKEVRMSKIFLQDKRAQSEVHELTIFTQSDQGVGEVITYYLNSGNIYKDITPDGQQNGIQINSSSVNVSKLDFYIGAVDSVYESSGYRQVTLVLELESVGGEVKINLQTSVASRPTACPTGQCSSLIPSP